MSTKSKPVDGAPEAQEDSQPLYQTDLFSVDTVNGTVVFNTTAPDETPFEAHVDGWIDTVTAKAGQLWIEVGRPLSDEPMIYLK